MTEFDIKAAKKGKPLITRSGLKARIVCWDRVDHKFNAPILALVLGKEGTWEMPVQYNTKGHIPYGHNPDYDLFME